MQGLPQTITKDDIALFFSKCGVIKKDDEGNNKIKLYLDPNGITKGDAVISYLRVFFKKLN